MTTGPGLSPGAKSLAHDLISYIDNDTGKVRRVKMEVLAEKSKRSIRHTRRLRQELEDLGLLVVRRTQTGNVYRATLLEPGALKSPPDTHVQSHRTPMSSPTGHPCPVPPDTHVQSHRTPMSSPTGHPCPVDLSTSSSTNFSSTPLSPSPQTPRVEAVATPEATPPTPPTDGGMEGGQDKIIPLNTISATHTEPTPTPKTTPTPVSEPVFEGASGNVSTAQAPPKATDATRTSSSPSQKRKPVKWPTPPQGRPLTPVNLRISQQQLLKLWQDAQKRSRASNVDLGAEPGLTQHLIKHWSRAELVGHLINIGPSVRCPWGALRSMLEGRWTHEPEPAPGTQTSCATTAPRKEKPPGQHGAFGARLTVAEGVAYHGLYMDYFDRVRAERAARGESP